MKLSTALIGVAFLTGAVAPAMATEVASIHSTYPHSLSQSRIQYRWYYRMFRNSGRDHVQARRDAETLMRTNGYEPLVVSDAYAEEVRLTYVENQ